MHTLSLLQNSRKLSGKEPISCPRFPTRQPAWGI